MNSKIVISGSGLYVPPEIVKNDELVSVYNAYVERFNRENAAAIAAGEVAAMRESTAEFIEKASGIKQRHVVNRSGILDIETMHPIIEKRADDELSIQAEFAVNAAKMAIENANKSSKDIDVVIVSCAELQRRYPGIAIEVQKELGIEGYAYDMTVACSSATFAIHMARSLLQAGTAKTVLLINPEICTGITNFRDRDSHFIFGDIATALIMETTKTMDSQHAFEVVDTKLWTKFSNNIRSNYGYLNRFEVKDCHQADKLFYQNGRKVFKDIVVKAASFIQEHLSENNLLSSELSRLWLHQANINMNKLIAEKLLGREATTEQAPITIDRYANNASAGSVIAFHENHSDLAVGDIGVLCSFGAGYSIGNVILRRIQ